LSDGRYRERGAPSSLVDVRPRALHDERRAMAFTVEIDSLRRALIAHERSQPTEVLPGIERKDAAVLVALRLGERPSVVLTARSSALREHSGELCFPGGKPQSDDGELACTALREAHEEIGLDPSRVIVLGPMSAVPTATSAYRLNPYLAVIEGDSPVEWSLSREVDRVVELTIESFVRGEVRFRVTMFPWRGAEHPTPFFEIDERTVIYGATAYVLWELFALLGALGVALPEPEVVPPPPWMHTLVRRFRELEAHVRDGAC
jgi:8-oxo-dGTP pyrophosphatase MutT (NUDIX family)